MNVSLRLTEKHFSELKGHLHNGDDLEAIAFCLCGRLNTGNENILLSHKIYLLPHDDCERAEDYVRWKLENVEHILEEAKENNFAIVKIHSHFVLNSPFSKLDDNSDSTFYESVYAWTDSNLPHLSLIMYPDGSFKGRVVDEKLNFHNVNSISIVGNNIKKYSYSLNTISDDFTQCYDRTKQAFGDKTSEILNNLKIGVVGCSGTGSPTVEQLIRLGVNEIVLVDPDKGELVNMNRIIGLTLDGAKQNKLKVHALKEHIERIGLNTNVKTLPNFIQDSQDVINELASCDFIFGCVDSAEGRYYLNLITHYYLVPLIDIGVKLSADGKGGINSINGNIHYVSPGSSSLLERKVFSSKSLFEDEVKRVSQEEYLDRQVYFDNINVQSPAVISVNMLHSSLAVCDFLARIHPYRYCDNFSYGATSVNLSNWEINYENAKESESRFFTKDTLGIGNLQPLININVNNEEDYIMDF